MLSHKIGRCMLLGTVCVLTLALLGCGGGTSISKPFGTDPNDTNKERVLNALVGSPSAGVDITQRGIPLNPAPLAFGQGTSYAAVSSGIAITTDAFQAGTAADLAPQSSVTMTRDFFYTEVIAGISGTSGATAPRLIQISDNFAASVPTGSVAVRVVNLSPDSPPVTLYNTAVAPPTAVPIIGLSNVAYGSVSSSGSTNYVTLTAGGYNLTVRDNAGNVLASPGSVTLAGGHSYSLLVLGLVHPTVGQPAARAVILTDQ